MGTDLSEVIAENFGANATYVEGLLSRFRSNPELVDESWRAYFTELLGNGEGATIPQSTSTPAAPATEDLRKTDNGRSDAAAADGQTAAAKAVAKTKATTA